MIRRLLRWLLRPAPRRWYAVRHRRTRAWLVVPSSLGAVYDLEFGPAVWYDEPDEAVLALFGGHLAPDDHQLVELTVQVNTNHYAMRDVPWGWPG